MGRRDSWWLVVLGACVFEIVAGIVTNPAPALVATAVLAFPAVVATGFTLVQFRQARLCAAGPCRVATARVFPVASQGSDGCLSKALSAAVSQVWLQIE